MKFPKTLFGNRTYQGRLAKHLYITEPREKHIIPVSPSPEPHSPSPEPWSPRELFIGGDQGFFIDPSDLSTLFQDTAGTVPIAIDGDPVGLFLDKSSKGNHLEQSSSLSKLFYRTDGSLFWLETDGIDDFLITQNNLPITGTDELTVCIGQKHLVNSPDGAIAELSVNRANNPGAYTFLSPSSSNRYSFIPRGSSTTNNTANATSAAYNAPHTGVLTALTKISPANTILRINGTQVATNNTNTGTGNWGSYPHYLGRRGGTSLPWRGLLYGMVIINRLLTVDEIDLLEAWMAEKTGVIL